MKPKKRNLAEQSISFILSVDAEHFLLVRQDGLLQVFWSHSFRAVTPYMFCTSQVSLVSSVKCPPQKHEQSHALSTHFSWCALRSSVVQLALSPSNCWRAHSNADVIKRPTRPL